MDGTLLHWDQMIRRCYEKDIDEVQAIINDAAEAFRGVIPDDCWCSPYMSRQELEREIEDGVVFWGYQEEGVLLAVMGLQDMTEVTLIRHAYTLTKRRRQGIGSLLLSHLIELAPVRPILVGTWTDADWAIDFYQENGFQLLPVDEKNRLLGRYWDIPERQVETSSVLRLN